MPHTAVLPLNYTHLIYIFYIIIYHSSYKNKTNTFTLIKKKNKDWVRRPKEKLEFSFLIHEIIVLPIKLLWLSKYIYK